MNLEYTFAPKVKPSLTAFVLLLRPPMWIRPVRSGVASKMARTHRVHLLEFVLPFLATVRVARAQVSRFGGALGMRTESKMATKGNTHRVFHWSLYRLFWLLQGRLSGVASKMVRARAEQLEMIGSEMATVRAPQAKS